MSLQTIVTQKARRVKIGKRDFLQKKVDFHFAIDYNARKSTEESGCQSIGGALMYRSDPSGSRNFDAVVIGAGMTGCATAYYLAKGGMKVALLEMRAICSGASGRNGGQVIQVEGRDELSPEMCSRKNSIAAPGIRLLGTLAEELEYDVEYRRTGSLDMAYSEEDVRIIKQVMGWQEKAGEDQLAFLNAAELKAFCPVFGEKALGAKLRKTDGNANPFRIAHAFAFAAQQRYGAEIFPYTKVEELLWSGDTVVGVRTNKGDFKAGHALVNATNAWTKSLFPDYPLMPCKILALVTEQLPDIPMPATETITTDEYDREPFLFYGGSQKDGNVIIGGPPVQLPLDMQDHFNEEITYEDLVRFKKLFARFWPGIGDVSLIRGWGGALGFTPDALPLVGRTRYRNLYMNAGFTNGMAWCPICGQLLAELIQQGKTSVPIDIMDPERFQGVAFQWPDRYNYTVLHGYIASMHAQKA
jgi:sarcosine oxidase subunit beta